MATIRINDIVLIFSGGVPFTTMLPIANDFDLKPYESQRDRQKLNRSLLADSRGADDIGANLPQVMASIRSFVKGRMDTIGQVCLLGRSNGCALALAVAAELNDLGIKDLAFVGLSDVPMWDDGRKPKVDKIGNFKVLNGPIAAGAVTPSGGIGGWLSISPARAVIPSVRLEREIAARRKVVNLFQIQGNQMKYARSVKRWIWWSNFSDGEVHGQLEGNFDNRSRVVPSTFFGDPLDFHVALNTGEHWQAMTSEAAAAFADFPREALVP